MAEAAVATVVKEGMLFKRGNWFCFGLGGLDDPFSNAQLHNIWQVSTSRIGVGDILYCLVMDDFWDTNSIKPRINRRNHKQRSLLTTLQSKVGSFVFNLHHDPVVNISSFCFCS